MFHRILMSIIQPRLLFLCFAFCHTAPATAADTRATSSGQAFPSRPIRLLSPFAPGGGNDIMSRTLGAAISKGLGQSIVVDNRPGANTIVAMEILARATPDGYTLLTTSSSQATNATLYKKLPYDSVRDFAPVSRIGVSPLVVAVNPSLPINSVRDLVSAAKAKPGSIMYPSAGTGNSTHLAGELFGVMAGVSLTHVPYKGLGPGLLDLMAGRLHTVFSTAPAALPHVKTGRLRALAVTSGARSALVPGVPTVAESGIPGYDASTWYGIIAPAGTPRTVIARLNQEITTALGTPEVRDQLMAAGADPAPNTPEQFAALIQSEIVKWAKIIKLSGAKVESP
jgi:tripartite-type tricarboxylate transporter receptor subunit TctC